MNAQRFSIPDDAWRWQALAWAAAHYSFVQFVNANGLEYPSGPFPDRLFAGAGRSVPFAGRHDLDQLYADHRRQPGWRVGYLSYDLKNQLERLASRHPDRLGFPDLFFAEPHYVLDFGPNRVDITGPDPQAAYEAIRAFPEPAIRAAPLRSGEPDGVATGAIRARVSPADYEATVRRIQEHIRAGDVYELNYCMEFFAEPARLDPVATYRRLTERSPMPFSVFLKHDERYLLGASPERFLKKTGRRLLSQPIKGTIRRGQTPAEDARLREQLRNSEKEQAENLMIVDLVRNDLARSAETGSVRVDELFGVYSFRQVHQLISSVSATLRAGLPFTDALKHAFPMGSMTGAPKIRAMELIDELEASRRGLFSGAVGFVTPDGDFDFNVVIRSLLYNADRHYVSFSVGSAITFDADPAAEYAECLLKAQALLSLFDAAAPTT